MKEPHLVRVARRSLLTLLLMLVLAGCSSQPPGSASASTPPSDTPLSGNIQITAKYLRFEQVAVEIPTGKGFKIDFDNKDSATVHDIDIHRNDPNGELVFDGTTLSGPASATYDVPALSAGTYAFVCSVHPDGMRGTMDAK